MKINPVVVIEVDGIEYRFLSSCAPPVYVGFLGIRATAQLQESKESFKEKIIRLTTNAK